MFLSLFYSFSSQLINIFFFPHELEAVSNKIVAHLFLNLFITQQRANCLEIQYKPKLMHSVALYCLFLTSYFQEVEILVYRNGQFISACLGGEIRFWNQDGREVMYLDRRRYDIEMIMMK